MPPMHYCEFLPAPHLRTWVAYHWHFRVDLEAGDELEHWVPPDGGMTLFFLEREDESLVMGPQLRPLRTSVRGGDVYWGSRLWPGAAPALLAVDPQSLRDGLLPIAAVEPAWAMRFAAELRGVRDPDDAARRLDALLDLLLATPRPLDPAVMTGVFRILRSRGHEPIAQVAAATGLSPRRFRQRFREAVGLTPKELARIRRFREAAIDAVTADEDAWVDLAAEHGYADQAHLVHEFRRLVGLSPESFRKTFRRIEHGQVLRRGVATDSYKTGAAPRR